MGLCVLSSVWRDGAGWPPPGVFSDSCNQFPQMSGFPSTHVLSHSSGVTSPTWVSLAYSQGGGRAGASWRLWGGGSRSCVQA